VIAFHRIAAVATGVLAAAAIGLTGAGPASASSTAQDLCVPHPVIFCADAPTPPFPQGLPVIEMNPPTAGVSVTNWFYPGSSFAQIRQADTQKCLQLDHAAANEVIEVACNPHHPNYQEWQAYDSPATGSVEYRSGWDTSFSYCLTYNGTKAVLDAQKCDKTNTYQFFLTH
jgi:hypothetical protein